MGLKTIGLTPGLLGLLPSQFTAPESAVTVSSSVTTKTQQMKSNQ